MRDPGGWSKRARNVLLLALLAACLGSCMNGSGDTESGRDEGVPPEPLPDILKPFSWDMPVKQLHALFPGAEIQDVHYTGVGGTKMIATIISGPSRDLFGEVVSTVVHQRYRQIAMVEIATTETRPRCFEPDRPRWCRSSYNAELKGILADLREELSAIYGPPIEFKGVGYHEAAGLPPDSRETTLKWERSGFDVFLDLTEGEESDWAVGLKAIRRDVPH